ncbi:MAG: site-specific integrase [Candidatus Omnitrophica bacterium]|nr:site-specific integrase [Candidatus Omnitrophota bacterium]
MYRKGRVYRRGKIWYIDFFADGHRVREAAGENKRFAETVLSKRLTEVAEGIFLNIRKFEKIKFKFFAQEYLEVHAKNKRSYHSDIDRTNTLHRYFGDKFLHEITPFEVEKFKTKRAGEVSGATVNRDLACLKCLFNKAIAWGRFNGKNPVKGVRLFKEQPRLRFLEKEEIFKLLANCDEHLKPIVIIALHTGMRKGEILNLKWHDIDFKRDIIYLCQTKNGEKREIRMNNEVKSFLLKIRKHPDSPYVFCNKNGEPFGDIKKSFFTACKKSGILKNSSFRFHDLRHTFASHLVMNGIDLNTVRELLGHKTLDMTLRYSHLSPDHKKRAVELLGDRLSANFGTKLAQWLNFEKLSTEDISDKSFVNKELVNT